MKVETHCCCVLSINCTFLFITENTAR